MKHIDIHFVIIAGRFKLPAGSFHFEFPSKSSKNKTMLFFKMTVIYVCIVMVGAFYLNEK